MRSAGFFGLVFPKINVVLGFTLFLGHLESSYKFVTLGLGQAATL
jgi:hypothetical protein